MELRRVLRGVVVWLASLAAVTLLGIVVLPSVPAAAGTPVSSLVISSTLPGMVAAPPGPYNGPVTGETLDEYLGGTSPDESTLRQAINDGNVQAYIRLWRNEPPNGTFVGIIAAQLPSSADAAAAMAGATQGQFGHFSVPGIPHAVGVTDGITTQQGVVEEDMVLFAKGTTLFNVIAGQLTTGSASEVAALNQPYAIMIAQRQDAFAPGQAVAPCGSCGGESTAYVVGRDFCFTAIVGAVIGLVVYLVRRSRKSVAPETAAWGFSPDGNASSGGWAPPAFPRPTGPGLAPAAAPVGTAVLERPAGKPDFHCGWCGTGVSVGSGVHDCGPRDRPAHYCMRCGTRFGEGAKTCTSCGSPKLQ